MSTDVRQSRLYSEDLAPVPAAGRKWGMALVMEKNRHRPPIVVMAALVAVAGVILLAAADFHAAQSWTPRKRPDRAFGPEWVFLGCESGAIDFNPFGEVPGYLCRWRRTSTAGPVVREERYMPDGKFYLAYERSDDGAEEYRIVFRDHGRSHLRFSEMPVQGGLFVVEVVSNGIVTARYASSWDSFFATGAGEIGFVPMDATLLWGESYPPIEGFQAHQDERAIRSLRSEGVDVSQPQSVEFGFWFEEDHRAAAIEGLLELGCRWLTTEERNGTIGPYPGHCAMKTLLETTSLAERHRVFTRFAKENEGRYYGWTPQHPRSSGSRPELR